KDANAKFIFLTPDDPAEIKAKANERKLPADSVIIRSVAREQVPLYISLCTFSVFFIRPSFSKKASSPTKMAEILFMGKPVITNAGIGDCDAIITENKAGSLIKKFDRVSYREAIDSLEQLLKYDEEHFSDI